MTKSDAAVLKGPWKKRLPNLTPDEGRILLYKMFLSTADEHTKEAVGRLIGNFADHYVAQKRRSGEIPKTTDAFVMEISQRYRV